jgi:SAM-dependent methyltransferase
VSGCHCCAVDRQFDQRIAGHDLRRFLRRGPLPVTRQLLAAIQSAPPPPGATVLDIGGGIGAVHHVLLDHGFARAIQVDASDAYLEVAAAEARRRGHESRVTFRHGDFRAVAKDLPASDVVTLDRVVCCDPDFTTLLDAAAGRTTYLLGYSYPRPRLLARVFVALGNAWRRLLGRQFRVYLHPPAAMDAVLARSGLRRRWTGGTWIWAAELFERP